MDVDLYKGGKQLLLERREALRSAGQLQHLPQLSQNASKIHQRHQLPETQAFQGQQYPEQSVKLGMAKAKGCM